MIYPFWWDDAILGPLLADLRRQMAQRPPRGGRARWRAWTDAYRRESQQIADVFVAGNGWHRAASGFWLRALALDGPTRAWLGAIEHGLDHPEYLTFGGHPVAVVSHNYAVEPPSQLAALAGGTRAAYAGLRIERLPDSWYWPGVTQAWLLRRAQAETRAA